MSHKAYILLLLALLVGNLFFGLRYYTAMKELEGTKTITNNGRNSNNN